MLFAAKVYNQRQFEFEIGALGDFQKGLKMEAAEETEVVLATREVLLGGLGLL